MRLSARESCPVCFHAILVSFAIWLILLYYINFTNFCLFVRAKVANLSLLKYFGKRHAINATLPYVDESNF